MLAGLRRFLYRTQASEKYELSYLFGQADPKASLPERVEWIASLIEWVRADASGGTLTVAAVRIRFILQWLDRHPEFKERGAETLRSVLRETDMHRLLIDIGLPSQPTFFSELRRRLWKVVVPQYPDPNSMAAVQARVFYDEHDAAWLELLPTELVREILNWVRLGLPKNEDIIPDWTPAFCEAIRVLAARSLAITLREDIERRADHVEFLRNPFARIIEHINDVSESSERIPSGCDAIRNEIAEARRMISKVRSHLEQTGVSVDLVYQLDRLRSDLSRITRLTGLIERSHREDGDLGFWGFAVEMVRGHQLDSDASAILRKHFGLLSKKIVERTGHSGEHDITQNSREYMHMMAMAAGSGILTAGTAFMKTVLPHDGPLFVEFALSALNYSVSFLLIYSFGFKLATKQPSMTAAALAGRLKEDGGQSDDEGFVAEIARIARSQFASVAGNLMAVIPAAFLIDFVHRTIRGTPLMTPEKAHGFLESINPAISATLPYAAWTGVLLWLSSMIAGWVENASVSMRFPEILRTHPGLRRWMGTEKAIKFSEAYSRNLSGAVAAISLGILLAATPIMGLFFGLPFDVRHVTLTTGSATFSALGLGHSLQMPTVLFSILGIACIGLLNFGVSFSLALFIAIRSRDLQSGRVRSIFRLALRRLLRHPNEFLFPPRTK